MTIHTFYHRLRTMKKALLLIFTLMLPFTLQASTRIIPDNELNLPPKEYSSQNKKSNDEVTEEDYLSVIKILTKIYAPVVLERSGFPLIIKTDWQDGTVNAYATREVDSWSVQVPGGIARAKGMTKDSLALIVCHEIGHHLGGAPRSFLYEGWPSAEGQADYWATSKCLKRYFETLAAEEISIGFDIPEKIISDCSSVYKSFIEVKVCIRTMLSSVAFANFLNQLPGSKVSISIETPDTRIVKGTNTNDYPRPQCRLDTLYQGALCSVASSVANSETDSVAGNCNDEMKAGSRPRCWYKTIIKD